SYGGQLDMELTELIRVFPAVWVTFAGISGTKRRTTVHNTYSVPGKFVVMVGDYSVRSEASTRMGGPHLDEVGSYKLVSAVRRLLSNQDLGLKIDALMPGAVRTLYNTRLGAQALSVFACEFETYWIEESLDCGRWPAPDSEAHPDYVFAQYRGKLDAPYPDLESINLKYTLPGAPDGEAAADDIIITREADDGSIDR
ncbi:phage protein Gp37, partial [Serratia fonticola]|uniref:phage protein Gp37 n=5 Tax=Serratia fonticola TaxID=47917 RepID=UPI00301DDFB9